MRQIPKSDSIVESTETSVDGWKSQKRVCERNEDSGKRPVRKMNRKKR